MAVRIAVFTASSESLAPASYQAIEELGRKLAGAGYDIVYGGGNRGLMGALARGVVAGGGSLSGVIPRAFREAGYCFEQAAEIIETENLSDRKRIMGEKSDAFLCLPGGLGTLDETFSVLAERQLGFHDKPVIFYNLDGFFTPLVAFLDRLTASGFIPKEQDGLYHLVESDAELLELLRRRFHKP